MERSYIRISLDLSGKAGACRPEIKQGDNHRSLYITLTDGGDPYTVSSDCSAVFVCKKPDEEVVYNFCTVENNTIIYDFTPQTTAVPGLLNCELRLYNAPRNLLTDREGHLVLWGNDVGLLTSVTFQVRIVSSVCTDEQILESYGEHSALTQLYAQTQSLVQLFNNALDQGRLTGPKGEKGDQGVPGRDGIDGKDGEKGEKGDKGDPGANALKDNVIGATGWSSQKIVSALCPSMEKEGAVFDFTPLYNSPICVIGYGGPTIQLQQTGKNLLDPVLYYNNAKPGSATLEGDVFTVNFTNSALYLNTFISDRTKTKLPAGTYTFTLFPQACNAKLVVFLYNSETGSQLTYQRLDSDVPVTYTFTTDVPFYLAIGGHTYPHTCSFKMQLEVGSIGTGYNRFRGIRTFILNERQDFFIDALQGCNSLYTLDGTLYAEYYGNPSEMLLAALKIKEVKI